MQERILAAAERRVRSLGFNAVSFRDLAKDVGIRSASVHYHFPRKEDLGEILVQRYASRFQARLGDIDIQIGGPVAALEGFVELYAEALVIGESLCLCAVLGAEANGLPDRVGAGVRQFFEASLQWLSDLYERMPASAALMTPIEILSALEGAMVVSTAMKDRAAFDAMARRILANYRDQV